MTSELLFIRAGFGADALEYLATWELQRALHSQRVTGTVPDLCLLLEHLPVYTAGKRTSPQDRPIGDPGAPVIDVDRGGKITWHGPGQLVGYPIIELPDPIDVISYVRAIEEALIRTCAEFGLEAARIEGRSGVWMPGQPGVAGGQDRKLAAIGIRVARGITMHGFALNCDNDMSWFSRIIPCGLTDATVTTMSQETGRHVGVQEVLPIVERHLADALGATDIAYLREISRLVPSGFSGPLAATGTTDYLAS